MKLLENDFIPKRLLEKYGHMSLEEVLIRFELLQKELDRIELKEWEKKNKRITLVQGKD